MAKPNINLTQKEILALLKLVNDRAPYPEFGEITREMVEETKAQDRAADKIAKLLPQN